MSFELQLLKKEVRTKALAWPIAPCKEDKCSDLSVLIYARLGQQQAQSLGIQRRLYQSLTICFLLGDKLLGVTHLPVWKLWKDKADTKRTQWARMTDQL